MTENLEKELEELRQQRNEFHTLLQKKGYEIAGLKRRICDELYTYPAYALLETLISLRKSAITPEAADRMEAIRNLTEEAENASNAH